MAGHCLSDNCAVIFIPRLQVVRSQNRVEITGCEKSQEMEVLDTRFVLDKEGKHNVVFAWVAAEDLSALEVGLLVRDET